MVSVKMALIMAFAILASEAFAVSYMNYTTAGNITDFGDAFDYSAQVTQEATGFGDSFAMMVLGTFFMCFYIIGSKYTQDRALAYAAFLNTVVAFLLVSGNFIDPKWLMFSIIALIAAVYLNRGN